LQVLKLLYQHNTQLLQKLPQIGERIAGGADGEVFSIKDDPHRVLKLGVLYETGSLKLTRAYGNIDRTLEHMEKTQPRAYVRVYRHGSLGVYARRDVSFYKGEQKFSIYYYLMDKLYPITEDEGKVFHSILSHEDRGIEKNFSPEKIQEMLRGMSLGLDFDAEKVTLFCSNIKEARLSHLDIAVRNIMKNEAGEFKLIDLDRISLENL
jgi:hypothetical protein